MKMELLTVEQLEQALPLEYRKGAAVLLQTLGPLYRAIQAPISMCPPVKVGYTVGVPLGSLDGTLRDQ
jgi:hypothetical protein